MIQDKGREFTAISTPDELVICVELPNGKIAKSYERRKISDNEIEVIQHRNRDRNGYYYVTRHIYRISQGVVVNPDFDLKREPKKGIGKQ